jgi:hypothetical protein
MLYLTLLRFPYFLPQFSNVHFIAIQYNFSVFASLRHLHVVIRAEKAKLELGTLSSIFSPITKVFYQIRYILVGAMEPSDNMPGAFEAAEWIQVHELKNEQPESISSKAIQC